MCFFAKWRHLLHLKHRPSHDVMEEVVRDEGHNKQKWRTAQGRSRVQLQCNVDEEEGKYIEAQPRCTCPSSESTLHWSLVDTEYNFRALLMRRRQVQRGAAELYLSSYRINIAVESGGHRVQLQSIVDEGEASTTRRSRVVLVFPPNQQCCGVGGVLPSATPAQCWRGGRQVHRGEAEVYLSSLRVNIAPGSVRSASAAVRFYISTLTQFLVHFLQDFIRPCWWSSPPIIAPNKMNLTSTTMSFVFNILCK